jgi:hypothetical protein
MESLSLINNPEMTHFFALDNVQEMRSFRFIGAWVQLNTVPPLFLFSTEEEGKASEPSISRPSPSPWPRSQATASSPR